jgi:hypothetical protein
MASKRRIGQNITAELALQPEEIFWLVGIALAILRAFTPDQGKPMKTIAADLEIARQTLYTTLRWIVSALIWLRRNNMTLARLLVQMGQLKTQLAGIQRACTALQAEVVKLSKTLAAAQTLVTNLQAEAADLKAGWTVAKDRLIVVLKMSGRCSVRSIVEVMEYGLGVHISIGYVQNVLSLAGQRAGVILPKLLKIIPLSGAICIDEVYLKELGKRVWGVVIVDPMSGLILHFVRCNERSKSAIDNVLKDFGKAGLNERITLCLTDMYSGYLEPVKTRLSNAVHQFCWFHINCFHIGATVRRAESAYHKAVKAIVSFNKKHRDPLSGVELKQLQVLLGEARSAYQNWAGAQRFQHMLKRTLNRSGHEQAAELLDRLIRVGSHSQNPYLQKMAAFLTDHRDGLLTFYTCLESWQHRLQRLSHSKQQWIPVVKRWAIPITSNAAEHVFRCLRRYTHTMNHFGTAEATKRFFDLFAFFHNLHMLRAGKNKGQSLLAAAQVDVIAHFGSDDPFMLLGFPPSNKIFAITKNVQCN